MSKRDENLHTLYNWHRGIKSHPHVVARPKSVDELVEIVTDTGKFPGPVRAFGSNHSVTECAVAQWGTAVDMRHFDQVWVDPDGPTVTAQGGARYHDVAKAVRRKGLQFNVNTEIGNVTMASAACAATKDASFPPAGYGQVSSYVKSAKLVAHDGSLLEISQDKDPELMRAFRSSYGLFGIVYEVTMSLRRIMSMDVDHVAVSIDAVPGWLEERMPGFRKSNTAMLAYLFPYIDKVVFETRNYSGVPSGRLGGNLWYIRNLAWRSWIPKLAQIAGVLPSRAARNAVLNGMHHVLVLVLDCFFKARHTDPSKQILKFPEHPWLGRFSFSMWAFPAGDYGSVLKDYFKFCRDHYDQTGYRTDLPHISYLIARDDNALLSYSHDGDIWSLDPVSSGHRKGWLPFLKEFNAFCAERSGKPLFNQTPLLSANLAEGAYEDRWRRFKVLVKEHDPGGRFLNGYFKDLMDDAA